MDEGDTSPVGIPIELEDTGLATVPVRQVADRTEPVVIPVIPVSVEQITDMWSTDSESTDFSIAFRRGVDRIDAETPPEKPAPKRRRVGQYRAITSV